MNGAFQEGVYTPLLARKLISSKVDSILPDGQSLSACSYKSQEVIFLAFKIFRKNCCGLDVHKTWSYACIGITDTNGRTEYKQARFSSFSKGLKELADWLGYTKPQKGNKTDRKDAKWICGLFMCDIIKPSFIPPADIRHLRDLVRYRFKLTCMITGEKNRAQNCLTVSNLKLDDVFSDVFGKSSRSITEQILAHPGETFDVAPFVDRRCKTPIGEIQAAIDGAVSPEQAVKLRQCLDHIDELEMHIEKVQQEILRLSDKYQAALDLARTVAGFDKNPMTAIQILSEIGGDMSVFPTAKHLVSWAGCCPRNDQSAGKIKSTRISRAGSYFKPVLVQVASALTRSKDHPEITNRYRRIKARRGHKKAIIAVCRMLLTVIWHILSDLKPYTPDGFVEPRPAEKSKVLTTAQALSLLKQRGYVISDSAPVLN